MHMSDKSGEKGEGGGVWNTVLWYCCGSRVNAPWEIRHIAPVWVYRSHSWLLLQCYSLTAQSVQTESVTFINAHAKQQNMDLSHSDGWCLDKKRAYLQVCVNLVCVCISHQYVWLYVYTCLCIQICFLMYVHTLMSILYTYVCKSMCVCV